MTTLLLRGVLALAGAVIVWLGLNVGLGGIPTLGWQGPTDFFTVTDQANYAVRDNHIHFLGGFWLGAGLVMVLGAVFLSQLRSALIALSGMIFVGGLARLSSQDTELLLSAQIAPSLFAEFILIPILGFWIYRSTITA